MNNYTFWLTCKAKKKNDIAYYPDHFIPMVKHGGAIHPHAVGIHLFSREKEIGQNGWEDGWSTLDFYF